MRAWGIYEMSASDQPAKKPPFAGQCMRRLNGGRNVCAMARAEASGRQESRRSKSAARRAAWSSGEGLLAAASAPQSASMAAAPTRGGKPRGIDNCGMSGRARGEPACRRGTHAPRALDASK